MLIGLISDTHGLLRPEAVAALEGTAVILHAGDVGGHTILRDLRAIAPVHAVRGNVDDVNDPMLQGHIAMTIDGLSVHVSHGHETGIPTPEKLLARYEADVIVYGHTHRALVQRSGARLVVNPGAAGPRRFDIRPSVARLTIVGGTANVEIVWLSR